MHLIKPLGAAAAALVLTACTTNPYTGEQQASKAATYGVGAAAVCGLVGAIDSGKHARNAALGCGIVGAGVGAYMDVQEAKLKEELQGTGVQVVREGDNIRLIMPGNITFETDSYNLRSSFYSVLNSVGQVLSKYAHRQHRKPPDSRRRCRRDAQTAFGCTGGFRCCRCGR